MRHMISGPSTREQKTRFCPPYAHRHQVKLQKSKLESLCRSLSEVPKGLRPIRTTSGRVTEAMGEEDNQLKGFGARLRWARQQCLRQTGNPHATQPTPARVGLPATCTLWLPYCCLDAVLCHLLCTHVCHQQPASVCPPVSGILLSMLGQTAAHCFCGYVKSCVDTCGTVWMV